MPKSRRCSTKPPSFPRSKATIHSARARIERFPKSITSLLKAGEYLSELSGIGKDPAGKIATIVGPGSDPNDRGAALGAAGRFACRTASYGAALMYFTGSKAHNISLLGLANDRGWKLNEFGLFAGKRRIAGATEEEIYQKLGLAMIPPEIREDRGEVALAQAGTLPRLITLADIRGDLHVHSNWSDGTAPIAGMGGRCEGDGLCLYGADRSQSARDDCAWAGRRKARAPARQIDRLNDKIDGFTVLKGAEVGILADGRLDRPA